MSDRRSRYALRPTWPLAIAAVLFLAGCQSVPLTGRNQVILISEQEERVLGARIYEETLSSATISQDPQLNKMVQTVGQRLARAADQTDTDWKFSVIEDDALANAFALPGGNVAIYTGLMPITRDEAGLAVVLAHEIGHVIARHGAERLSTRKLVQLGEIGLQIALGEKNPRSRKTIEHAYGIGTGLGVLLPFNRRHESEADRIGLHLMARAGYDPEAALHFWERMTAAKSDRNHPPEFLSTHPSDTRRIQKIRQWLSEITGRQHPSASDINGELHGQN